MHICHFLKSLIVITSKILKRSAEYYFVLFWVLFYKVEYDFVKHF